VRGQEALLIFCDTVQDVHIIFGIKQQQQQQKKEIVKEEKMRLSKVC